MSEYTPLVEEDTSDEPLGPVSGLWRSEEMCLLAVRFEIPLLERLLHRLGNLGCAEFRDINKGGGGNDAVVRKAREFKDKLRACENIERKLRYFEDLYPRYPLQRGNSSPSRVRSQEGAGGWKQGALGVPAFETKGKWWDEADALPQFEKQIHEEERALRDQQVANIDANLNDYCKLLEQEAVLSCLQTRELHMDSARDSLSAALPLTRKTSETAIMSKVHGDDAMAMRSITSQGTFADRGGSGGFGSMVGTIEADKVLTFKRLVDRVSKRNAVVVTTSPGCSQGGSMDLYQLHRTCVIESRRQSADALSPSAGGADALADVQELHRVEQDICGFMIYFSSNNVMQRLLKLCASHGRLHFINPMTTPGTMVEPPESLAKRYNAELLPQTDLTESILERRARAKEKLTMTNRLVDSVVADLRRLELHADERKCYILKEKAVYAAVANMQMSSDGVGEIKLDAHLWVPRRKKRRVEDAIADVLKGSPSYCTEKDIKEAKEGPPTWFETNVFTDTFQGIVNSYGVPRYQETNPAIWTIITFPWLFGVMYGDIGHGIMIALSAAVMIMYEKKFLGTKQNEMVEMIFGARWLLLLMGLFAIYIGFIYNDTFGMMLEFSPSRYKFPDQWEHFRHDEIEEYQVLGLNGTLEQLWDGTVYPTCGACPPGEFRPRTDIPMYDWDATEIVKEVLSCPYSFSGRSPHSCATPLGWGQPNNPARPQATMSPNDGPTPFGVDVAWAEAENKLDFYNSFKMKNAVIIGIVQMTLGLFLSLCNYIFRKDWNHILYGFIPEIMFLFCTFGYMAVMITVKWNTEWNASNTAPNVLESMTNFFLSPGEYTEFDNSACNDPNNTIFKDCSGYQKLYEGQMGVQLILVILAFAVLPLMLVPIPVITWRKKKAMSNSPDIEVREAAEEIDMQEVVIKQVIHVIEYVLGTVSNTASYLRLWALSLAHAELSEVFLNYAFFIVLEESEGVGGGFMMYAAFAVWLSVTFGVLIIMEALSAFLHALRLHWVEFQNKFYVGDGRAFEPLCFRSVLEAHGVSAKVSAVETRF